RLVAGVGWAYLLRGSSFQQIDPYSLEKVGTPIEVGAEVAGAVIDDQGVLWASVPSKGDIVAIRDGAYDRTFKGGREQDQLEPVVANGRPALTNGTSREARRSALGGLDDPAS